MILSSIFTTVNVSLNSMIDSAKYKYLIIELIAILIATPHLSAQGLQFFGNKVPIEQRTSYTIFSKKLV